MVENKNSFKSKRNVVLILFLIVLNWQNLLSQANPIGPNLDNPSIKAFDQFGNQYDPVQLIVLDPGSNYGIGAKAPYTASCTAGYFNVYFGPNSGMDQSNTLHQQRRNVVCQVFYDLSMLINSPLNFNIGSPKVNIYVDDISQYVSSPSSSGVLGIASSYFAEKLNNGVSGVIPGEVWKTIKLGNDSYINTWPIASNNYYHGFVAFNFQNSSIDWDISLSTNTITSTQNDFYTVVLHEATHCLGFSSLISSNGNSVFGINQNYYSFYDLNLKNTNNVSLISNSPSSCNRYGYYFNTSSSFLSPTCPNSTVDVTTCSLSINYSSSYNIPVYTPGCYDNSSLSHFEDLCYAPSSFSLSPPNSNNKYFVMSNSQTLGLAGVKRYLKIEERQVLCDLGYSLNSINNSTVNGAFYNYSVSCPGRDIAGLNDGLNGSVFTYSTSIGIPLTISNINSNDRNATGGYQCLEVLAPSQGLLNITSGGYNSPFTYTPTGNPGIHILRYIPRNAISEQGNITYIYVFVSPNYSTCVTNSCNLVTNGNLKMVLIPQLNLK